MNDANTAAQAIDRSIRHNEIVTLPEYCREDHDTLLSECEDWAEGDKLEFWGTTQSGEEWRVHMTRG